jgi:hypothetical protein
MNSLQIVLTYIYPSTFNPNSHGPFFHFILLPQVSLNLVAQVT